MTYEYYDSVTVDSRPPPRRRHLLRSRNERTSNVRYLTSSKPFPERGVGIRPEVGYPT